MSGPGEPRGGQVERRLAAILSADVVGYSRLMADDEQATIRTITAYRKAIGDLVEEHRGRVVDSPGDNLLAEFPTALDAVEAAVEIQKVLKARNEGLPGDRRMEFRIGVHLGDVSVQEGRLYGDGVNIAARLEGLAEPAGICVSAEVYGQVENRLDVGFEDLGEQSVKNIAKPVHAYRVLLDAAQEETTKPRRSAGCRRLKIGSASIAVVIGLLAAIVWLSWPAPLGWVLDFYGLSELPTNPPLPDKPSLVVLPFDNLSPDPEQAFFADGITEELTASLSSFSDLFVISRNTAFTYKERTATVQQVGRELGVRYVLEGSVRKSGERVRITAQLIEAATDHHVWSDRYDRELADIFSVQSEIADEILRALSIQIREAEAQRIRRIPTQDLTAYQSYVRAAVLVRRMTRRDNEAAQELLRQAIELDPSFTEAHAVLGATFLIPFIGGWETDPATLDRAESLARESISMDARSPNAHAILASILTQKNRTAEARASAEMAAALGPGAEENRMSLAVLQLLDGSILAALGGLREAIRHDPNPSPAILGLLGALNYRAGRTSKALELWERSRAASPDFIPGRLFLVYHYQSAGQTERVSELVREIRRANPEYSASNARQFAVAVRPEDPEIFLDTLRNAGLSKKPDTTTSDLSGRPSMIVLPFDNLSGDPEQEYFADGITEDLTTALSQAGTLLVLSRNTAFTYKGQAVKPEELREELGVRYFVEGSVRRVEDRVRINVQLIDTETGGHTWAEQYDREMTDIFEVQSEIVRSVLARLNIELMEAEFRRIRRGPIRNLDAYDAFMRAMYHSRRLSFDDMKEARRFARKALEIDPEHAGAMGLLGSSYVIEYLLGGMAGDEALLHRAAELGHSSLQQDPSQPEARLTLAGALQMMGDPAALQHAEAAVELAPSDDRAHSIHAFLLVRSGAYDRARQTLELMERLNPRFRVPGIPMARAAILMSEGQRDGAIQQLEEARRTSDDYPLARIWLADQYVRLGRHDDASRMASELLDTRPDFTAQQGVSMAMRLFVPPDDPDQMLANLRKAGLP
jgi:adenylate cyclase